MLKKSWYDRRWFKFMIWIIGAIIGIFGGISLSTVRQIGTAAALPFMAPYVHGEIKTHANTERASRDSAIHASEDSTTARCSRLVTSAVEQGTYNIIDKLDRTWPAFHQVVDSTDKQSLKDYRRQKKLQQFIAH